SWRGAQKVRAARCPRRALATDLRRPAAATLAISTSTRSSILTSTPSRSASPELFLRAVAAERNRLRVAGARVPPRRPILRLLERVGGNSAALDGAAPALGCVLPPLQCDQRIDAADGPHRRGSSGRPCRRSATVNVAEAARRPVLGVALAVVLVGP